MKRINGYLALAIGMATLTGCEALIPASAYIQPATVNKAIAARSLPAAMKAAISVASSSDWTPKTISNETGYLLAERGVRVGARDGGGDVFKLEVYLPGSGKGEVKVKVSPPPGVMGSVSTEKMASDYLNALSAAVSSK